MIHCASPSAQFKSYENEIEAAVLAVMRGNRFILGVEVEQLEKEFSAYIGTSQAVGVANGTDAIELALRALNIGIGDEVITVSHTAVATAAAIEAAGAIPVLVDVEPQFYTLNPRQLDEVITPKTKAIVVVHLYGQSADLDAINGFCQSNGLYLIEDCAQAHGGKYKGKRVGSIGDVGCFSCYPTKNLGAIGDAGLITTNNVELANKIRMLREYGWSHRVSEYPGRNSRLDEIQAAVLRVKLKYLDSDNEKRQQLAAYYNEHLVHLPVQTPKTRSDVTPVFHLYVIQVPDQHKFIEYLLNQGIQAGIHYSVPVHLQPAYKSRIPVASNMGVTEALAQRIVSLPMYPELSISQVRKITNTITNFFELDL